MRLKLIGAGGIGTWLFPPLCRYLNYHPEYRDDTEVTVIDGDSYEERNRDRQEFADFGNKAQQTTDRLQAEFPNLYFDHKPEYLTEDNIILHIRDGDIVMLCVDNHATRKLISDHCQELDNVLVISGGNDYEDGNVMIYRRENGEDITLPLANDYHPEIQEPDDENPGDVEQEREGGCDVQVAADPQLLFANFRVASHMMSAFYSYLEGNGHLNYDEVYFNVRGDKTKKYSRTRGEVLKS